jgi:hypothetical protein
MAIPIWTVAKTYADAPHEYVIQANAPEIFADFAAKLKTQGVKESFTLRGKTTKYKYYYPGDGYKYWIIGCVLNRCQALWMH